MNIERFVEVVINELLNERRNEVVGDFGVGVSQYTRRINVFSHGVNPNPRHLVHPGQFVLVVRLMLVKDDREVECIVHLFGAERFNDWKISGDGCVGDVFCVPCMREGFSTVVTGGILCGERSPDVALVLPLCVDDDFKRCLLYTSPSPRDPH